MKRLKKVSVNVVFAVSVGLMPSMLSAAQPVSKTTPKVQVRQTVRQQFDFNQLVLNSIKKMPKGGGYSVSRSAAVALSNSMRYSESGKFTVKSKYARPSYCSGATYLVFLYTLKEVEKRTEFRLHPSASVALYANQQKDGVGVWGRWNANGPGTSRFFTETKIGRNFESYRDARPGDFMKIFWTDEIGRKEFGHSVIYLGRYMKKGETMVKFWSSNKPGGYGEKSVPMSKIKWAVFSRITDITKGRNHTE